MRGTDYRCQGQGIALVVGKAFDNERELDQGLGRVGRNGDEYRRMKLKRVTELYDRLGQLRQVQTMVQVSMEIAQKAKLAIPISKGATSTRA